MSDVRSLFKGTVVIIIGFMKETVKFFVSNVVGFMMARSSPTHASDAKKKLIVFMGYLFRIDVKGAKMNW